MDGPPVHRLRMAAGDLNLGRPAPTAKNDLRVSEIRAVALVPSGDNPDAEIVLVKADPRNPGEEAATADVAGMPNNPSNATGQPPEGGGPDNKTDDVLKSQLDAVLAQNELLAKQNELLIKHLEEGDDDDAYGDDDGGEYAYEDGEGFDGEDDDEIGKADPDADIDELLKANPAFANVLKAYDEQIAILKAQADEAHAIAKAEEDQRLTVQFAKRAEAFDVLGLDRDVVAKTLRDCFDECSVDTYRAVEKMLAQAATILEENNSLTGEVGKSDAEGGYGNDKWAELMAKTANDPQMANLTREQQLAEALRNDPALYGELEAAATNGRTSR